MDPKLRVVVRMPLNELWDDSGVLGYRRVQSVSANEIRERLKIGPVQFVVGDVGSPLEWVACADSFQFWKLAAAKIAPPTAAINLDDYAGGSCYFASRWERGGADELFLLERHH